MNLVTQIELLANQATRQTTDGAEAMRFAQAAQNLAQTMAVIEAIPSKPVDLDKKAQATGLRVVAFRVEALRLKKGGMDFEEVFSRLCLENLNLEYKGTEFEIRGIANSVFYKKLD